MTYFGTCDKSHRPARKNTDHPYFHHGWFLCSTEDIIFILFVSLLSHFWLIHFFHLRLLYQPYLGLCQAPCVQSHQRQPMSFILNQGPGPWKPCFPVKIMAYSEQTRSIILNIMPADGFASFVIIAVAKIDFPSKCIGGVLSKLTSWWCTVPGHQQPWYWPSYPGIFQFQHQGFHSLKRCH